MSFLTASALVLSLMPLRLYGWKTGPSCQTSYSTCHVKWCPEKVCKSDSQGVQDLCGISNSTSYKHSQVIKPKSKQDKVEQPKSIWISSACAEIRLVSVTDNEIKDPYGIIYTLHATVPAHFKTHWRLECGNTPSGCSSVLPLNIIDGDKTHYSYAIASKAGLANTCPTGSCRMNTCVDEDNWFSEDVKAPICSEITYVKMECLPRGSTMAPNEGAFDWGLFGPGTGWVSKGSVVGIAMDIRLKEDPIDWYVCADPKGCFFSLTSWKYVSFFKCPNYDLKLLLNHYSPLVE